MQTLKARIAETLELAVDAVLPPRCVVSGQMVERQGMIAPDIWAELDFIAAPFCGACGFPFDFAVEGEALCGPCLGARPPYETARAALKYNEASRSMILGFKHGDKTHAVRAFIPWLKRAGKDMLAEADFVAPVPLHFWRLLRRRYNQAALIAQAVAKEEGREIIPDLLIRTRATQSQGHLKAKQRFRNVRRAFIVHPKYVETIKGKTIVLVDDVYTTGATVRECAKVLMKAGAGKVHVLTLARVVRDGFF